MGFDQSERAHGPIYIINESKRHPFTESKSSMSQLIHAFRYEMIWAVKCLFKMFMAHQ